MARYALNKKEKMDAFFVGGGSFLGVFFLALGIFLKFVPLIVISPSMIAATIPLSVTFNNDHKAGSFLYGFIAAYILLAGVVLVIGASLYGDNIQNLSGFFKFLPGSAIIFFILGSWSATFGFLRK
jgi:hypothetical protein